MISPFTIGVHSVPINQDIGQIYSTKSTIIDLYEATTGSIIVKLDLTDPEPFVVHPDGLCEHPIVLKAVNVKRARTHWSKTKGGLVPLKAAVASADRLVHG